MAELIAGEISENGSYELRRKMLNFSFGSSGGAFGSLLVLNAGITPTTRVERSSELTLCDDLLALPEAGLTFVA